MIFNFEKTKKLNHLKICTIDTIYGEIDIEDEVIIELINSKAFQRLKKINQSGVTYFILENEIFTRYQHSVGVYALLKKYNLSLKEQIAGLLHDVSHTVFSHLADELFNHNAKDSYQDEIHEWYIQQTDIPTILEKHNFSVKEILHKNNNFIALEQDLPNLCADRIDYNLQTAIREKNISKKEVKSILDNLKFDGKNWFFENVNIAKKFGEISLYLTKNVWASSNNRFIYYFASQALKHALKINIITKEQIHFSTDDIIWNILINSDDQTIKNLINKILNFEKNYKIGSKENYDVFLSGKFRGVDPLIKIDNQLIKLTELDKDFNKKFFELKKETEEGFYIILK